MRTFPPRITSFALGTVLWVLAACGDSAAPIAPITPQSLAVTGGNLQTGCFADPLHDSLEVTLTGSDNKPFAGAPVAWRVSSGLATIRPALDTTDASGKSRAQLTVGFVTTRTPIAVEASSAGLSPGAFTITPAIAPYALGQTASGTLASSDCDFGDGSFIDYYVLGLASAQSFMLSLTSGAFDAVVWVFDSATPGLAANDDSAGVVVNSFLKMIAAPGDYLVGANSYYPGALGAYTLTTTATPVQADSCLFDLFVTRGITTAQTVASTDCVDTSGPYYADLYQVVLRSGQTITITERSTAFDAYLFLFDHSGATVASDDNSGGGSGGTDARLTYQTTSSGDYYIAAATAAVGATGAYTLTIDPPPPTERAATTSRSSAVLPPRPLRIAAAPPSKPALRWWDPRAARGTRVWVRPTS